MRFWRRKKPPRMTTREAAEACPHGRECRNTICQAMWRLKDLGAWE